MKVERKGKEKGKGKVGHVVSVFLRKILTLTKTRFFDLIIKRD